MALFVLPQYYGSCCQNLNLVKYNERVFPVHIPEVGSLDLIQEIIPSHYYCQDELREAWCIQKLLFQLIEIRKNGHKCHITSERFIVLLFRIHVNTGVYWRWGAHTQISELHRLPISPTKLNLRLCYISLCLDYNFCQLWLLMNDFNIYSMDFSNTLCISWWGENP